MKYQSLIKAIKIGKFLVNNLLFLTVIKKKLYANNAINPGTSIFVWVISLIEDTSSRSKGIMIEIFLT